MGNLDILNVGAGHLSIQLDDSNPVDMERARRMITDMLRRGYALFIEVDGALSPVREFDEKRGVYIVTDVPGTPVADAIDDGPPIETAPEKLICPRCGRDKHRGRCRKTHEVPMSKAKATAVGRSAGG